MLKRFIVIFFILLLIFLFLAKRGAGAQNIAITQTPPEGAVLLLNLPRVFLLPTSPFYFLIKFWDETRLFLAATPEQKTALFLSLAEQKMAETIKMFTIHNSGFTGNKEDKTIKDLVDNYQGYLQQGYQFFNLVQNPQKREQLHWEIEKQGKNFELFKNFLEKIGIEVEWEVLL